MPSQEPWTREGFGADGATVLEVVGQDVHRQRWHTHVDLATVRALLGVLAVRAAVGLAVAGKVR